MMSVEVVWRGRAGSAGADILDLIIYPSLIFPEPHQGIMNKKFVIICTLGTMLASGTWYMTWKHRRLNEEIMRKERELQELTDMLWKRRVFWLKLCTGFLGVGGVVYVFKRLAREIRNVKLS